MCLRKRNANPRSCLQALCASSATCQKPILPNAISVQLFQKVIHSKSTSYNKTRNTLYYVHYKLWRWATRRHPNKPQAWKKRKYFSAAGKAGVFSVKVHRATGESRVLKLYSMASTKIERHIKVRGAANPYDSRYTEYFAQRRCFAWRVLGGGPNAPVASTLSG